MAVRVREKWHAQVAMKPFVDSIYVILLQMNVLLITKTRKGVSLSRDSRYMRLHSRQRIHEMKRMTIFIR